MKKILSLISAAAVVAASLFVSACGSATVEYTVSEDGTHYIISGVSGNKSSLAVYDIPATFDDGEHGELPVTEIGESAFMGCSLAKVTIPDSITYIGDLAFAYNYIYDLVLPESLEYIGYGAFAYSSAVEELVIPASVTQLGPFAFAYCGKLSKVEVLAQVDTIYIGTFRGIVANDTSGVYYDTNLTEVRFPATLKNLHRDALADNFITDIYYAGTAAQWQEVEIFYAEERLPEDGEEDEEPEVVTVCLDEKEKIEYFSIEGLTVHCSDADLTYSGGNIQGLPLQ